MFKITHISMTLTVLSDVTNFFRRSPFWEVTGYATLATLLKLRRLYISLCFDLLTAGYYLIRILSINYLILISSSMLIYVQKNVILQERKC